MPPLIAADLTEGFYPTPMKQGIALDVIDKARRSFKPDGFKSFGQYRWDNPLCRPYDHSVGRCVGLYQDDRLSIYPVKDAGPDGDYGHAIIHGRVKFTKKDIENGEGNKWIGST